MNKLRTWLVMVMLPLFLAAQQGALLHQVGHLLDGAAVGQAQQGDSSKGVDGGFCDYHVAFAEVLGAIDCSTPPLALAGNAAERRFGRPVLPSPTGFIQPASRGPPVLL